ncbi:MAG TPA: FkbM family methyltransferase [Sphingobacteriaceae bacterium]
MLKDYLKLFLQKILGFKTYLFIFSILTIKRTKHEEEFLYFNKMIPDGGTVLDIGANIGAMTVLMGKSAKNAFIYAFEPMPENAETLKKIVNFYKLKNVKIFEAALGEQKGELKMVMPVISNIKMQGLSHVLEEGSDEEWNKGEVFSVPVLKLDEIEELRNGNRITAIKIDVENFEYHVLKGGEELLLKHKPIIFCELWENDKRVLTLNYLQNLGYKVQVYEDNQLKDYTDQKALNFFFVPNAA